MSNEICRKIVNAIYLKVKFRALEGFFGGILDFFGVAGKKFVLQKSWG